MFVDAKAATKMKSFIKLPFCDEIISSIYNTQDNANIVWKGHWPILVCPCHCVNECLMVNTLKASSNSGKSEQLPGPECVF